MSRLRKKTLTTGGESLLNVACRGFTGLAALGIKAAEPCDDVFGADGVLAKADREGGQEALGSVLL